MTEALRPVVVMRPATCSYPRPELHVVVNNYRTHKHPDVAPWLEHHPCITRQFTRPQARG